MQTTKKTLQGVLDFQSYLRSLRELIISNYICSNKYITTVNCWIILRICIPTHKPTFNSNLPALICFDSLCVAINYGPFAIN